MQNTKIWNARWSDGQTAAAREVEVTLDRDVLIIKPIDQSGTLPQRWPYERITSPHPIHANDQQVLLSFKDKPGERLFIADEHFAKRILDQAPGITHGAHTWGLLKWPLGIAAAIVLFWALTWFNIISPATTLAALMPDGARQKLGKAVVETVRNKRKVCTSAKGDLSLTKLLTRLKPATGKGKTYDVKVVDLAFVNAFAAPGDQIIVSGKLIEEASNAEEVAGVIAHEIGHAIERHPEANLIRVFGIITIMQIMTAGESGTISDLAFFLVQSGYSRIAEEEADEHAKRILTKVNVSTKPLAGFFERLLNRRSFTKKKKNDKAQPPKTADNTKNNDQKDISADQKQSTATPEKSSEDRGFFKWISTHPATKSRIAKFNKSTITTSPPILTEIEWKALKSICGKKTSKKKADEKAGNKNSPKETELEGDDI